MTTQRYSTDGARMAAALSQCAHEEGLVSWKYEGGDRQHNKRFHYADLDEVMARCAREFAAEPEKNIGGPALVAPPHPWSRGR